MGPSPNLNEHNIVPDSEGTARGERASMKPRTAASPTHCSGPGVRAPEELATRQAGSSERVFPAHVGCHACVCARPYTPRTPTERREARVAARTSWRGREGGARRGAWQEPPASCTYVSLATVSPFEDSLLMQPWAESGGAGEGATHALSVCNQ